MSEAVTVAAPAKVNLFLRVLAREDTGYHTIETAFCRLSLADTLTVGPAPDGGDRRESPPDVQLEVRGRIDTGPRESNLAYLGARAVLGAVRGSGRGREVLSQGLRLVLDKHIPARTGLGGGSSDAAAALLGVNQYLGNPIPQHELFQMGARLGADVAFFLSGARLALAWGRGDRLFRLPPLPPAPTLLVIPAVGVSTREAYEWLDATPPAHGGQDPQGGSKGAGSGRGGLALDAEALGTWGSIGRMAGNDFETVVFGRHPALREAYEALARTHPLVCRLSGSGAALYAVYRTPGARDDARGMLGRKHGQVIATEAG